MKLALAARRHAYAPYSGFSVGAAVLTKSGRIYSGANVENATFGATICAERSAVSAAVSAGERTLEAAAIATDTSPPSPPCGICRQVLAEFGPIMAVILVNPRGETIETDLEELLPMNFVLPSST